MKTVGIVCEYNPLHLGHARQMAAIREAFGADSAIVCAISGNFVQRGHPAIFDKSLRAQAALLAGADLVVEIPLPQCLSSAEGFAQGGVAILSRLCHTLCFGAESPDGPRLMATAQALLGEDFPPLLRRQLQLGKSFPAAREAALAQLGLTGPQTPNDILGVEYCKAILLLAPQMEIYPLHRPGSYHADRPDPENPSATALRRLLLESQPWEAYVPEAVEPLFAGASLHALAAGERAVLGRLRAMTEGEFESLPFGSEGLWRKLMHECRRQPSLEAILTAVKSKRYTRTRLERMVMCAFLGLQQEDLLAPIPYARVLAFNARGQALLSSARKTGFFPNAGEAIPGRAWELEQRAGDLYGLFALDAPEPPGREKKRRVVRVL